MKRELVAAFLQLLLGLHCCYASHHPPPLVYPNGGILKLLIGGTVPIAMPNGRIFVYGHNIQYQFNLPANASLFGETPKLRERRAVTNEEAEGEEEDERGLFYRMVEHELERRGRPSKDCLKRSICESAETPLRDDGLLGEIFHVLLTPDYGDSRQRWQRHREYIEAAEIGRNGLLDCLEAFPDCPPGSGLLDHVSRLLFAQD
ncbi:hypothetical protein TKK_0003215 [Trichogramma kaykai]